LKLSFLISGHRPLQEFSRFRLTHQTTLSLTRQLILRSIYSICSIAFPHNSLQCVIVLRIPNIPLSKAYYPLPLPPSPKPQAPSPYPYPVHCISVSLCLLPRGTFGGKGESKLLKVVGLLVGPLIRKDEFRSAKGLFGPKNGLLNGLVSRRMCLSTNFLRVLGNESL